jgi:hypothetical protein
MDRMGLAINPDRPFRGGEVGWIREGPRYTVVAWDSCLIKVIDECRFREAQIVAGILNELPFYKSEVVSRPPDEDAGHILILKNFPDGKMMPAYYAREVRRTENFVTNFCARAWITTYKVIHLPPCPQCGGEMEIYKTRKKGYCYMCFRLTAAHESTKPPSVTWHSNLPENARKIAERWDESAERTRNETEKRTGKKPEPHYVVKGRANRKRIAKAKGGAQAAA